jgi:hypothetical protein
MDQIQQEFDPGSLICCFETLVSFDIQYLLHETCFLNTVVDCILHNARLLRT